MPRRPRTADQAANPAPPVSSIDDLPAVQAALTAWFRAHGRDLPWRRTRDPWAVLVAEVMLQQVQVARAIPFWDAFLVRFPTPAALAAATLAEAIRVWADLGRYRRVVNLHRTARILTEQHGGAVPDDPAVLVTLPGIGAYTAGAVACFAFERDEAFLDTNIRRVLYRILVGPEPDGTDRADRSITQLAACSVPPGDGWAWNQALMDLGATVCTARKPACDTCPVAPWCRARPGIATALAARHAARKSTGRPVYRYEGSDRFYRGRVLAELRALPDDPAAAIPLTDLGAGLRADFSDEHVGWLRGVVASLERDGLAVAEERPAWDASAGPATVEIVVKLPD